MLSVTYILIFNFEDVYLQSSLNNMKKCQYRNIRNVEKIEEEPPTSNKHRLYLKIGSY